LRILYHHRTASRDGQAVHVDEMIAAFRSLGHEVVVVAPNIRDATSMGAELPWVAKFRAFVPRCLYEMAELAYSLVAYRRLARAVRTFCPHFIYERYNLFLLAGLLAARRFKIPLLLEVNSPLAEERGRFGQLTLRRLADWAEAKVWQGADQVLPVTRVLASHVVDRGVSKDRITVISNGVNLNYFATAPHPEQAKVALGLADRRVLGFTGFVRDWHGIDRVLHWMAEMPRSPRLHLLIVGDGPARAGLEKLAAKLDMTDFVTFTGVIQRTDVPRHVAAFDIALQPAVTPYASPLKIFEYLALGKAIVAPQHDNLKEILQDGYNALLFDAEDPTAFGSAVAKLLDDDVLRVALGNAAARTIAERGLSWEDAARRVCELGMHLSRPAARR
jgi:glycosyltransferase involved in cell wall biosynthesis